MGYRRVEAHARLHCKRSQCDAGTRHSMHSKRVRRKNVGSTDTDRPTEGLAGKEAPLLIARFSIRAGKMKNGLHPGDTAQTHLKRPLSSAKQPVPAEGGVPLINSHVALGTGCVALQNLRSFWELHGVNKTILLCNRVKWQMREEGCLHSDRPF